MRSLLLLAPALLAAQGLRVEPFAAEIRTIHDAAAGLPSDDVVSVAVDAAGGAWAATRSGLARRVGATWRRVADEASVVAAGDGMWFASRDALWRIAADSLAQRVAALPAPARHIAAGSQVFVSTAAGLFRLAGSRLEREPGLPGGDARQAALARDGRVAAALSSGLFLKARGGSWQRVLPKSGNRSWAPDDVRGVAFDAKDRLWFASPQGAGRLDGNVWALYTGADGLPYDDFTTVAAGDDGAVWFGTRIGAIRYDGKTWEYRQGRRWLPDDDVRAIGAGAAGEVWIATAKGIARIERRVTTLAGKARFFEAEIDRRHRRTPYGYVLDVALKRPGDVSEWVQRDSDNDGLWTSMYGAGECFAAAATGSEEARRRAVSAFEALRFLGAVTQGGPNPAPRGFVARSVLPAAGPNPNREDSAERDRQMRETRDRLWKSLTPRWPLSADGQWYWKADTSSDELDGHYFFLWGVLRPGGAVGRREAGGAGARFGADGSSGGPQLPTRGP